MPIDNGKRMKRFMRILGLSSGLLASLAALAAPDADLWERWTKHQADSVETIDHSTWQALLQKHVQVSDDGINRVSYAQFSKTDKASLQDYIQTLSALTISEYNRREQRAYWINLYNALTVQEILKHYPLEGILDIKYSLLSRGPWKEKLLEIEGEDISLDDIEHRILRPIWNDPRTHYAVNCASLGCPNLSRDAYTADNLDMLLTRGAFEFINHPRGVNINEDGKLIVSSIYNWFADDFGSEDKAIIQHLFQHATPSLAKQLEQVEKIENDQYDWALNEAK